MKKNKCIILDDKIIILKNIKDILIRDDENFSYIDIIYKKKETIALKFTNEDQRDNWFAELLKI